MNSSELFTWNYNWVREKVSVDTDSETFDRLRARRRWIHLSAINRKSTKSRFESPEKQFRVTTSLNDSGALLTAQIIVKLRWVLEVLDDFPVSTGSLHLKQLFNNHEPSFDGEKKILFVPVRDHRRGYQRGFLCGCLLENKNEWDWRVRLKPVVWETWACCKFLINFLRLSSSVKLILAPCARFACKYLDYQ